MRLHLCVVLLVQVLVYSVCEDQAIVHVVLLAPRKGTCTRGAGLRFIAPALPAALMDGECKSANQACLLPLRSYNACGPLFVRHFLSFRPSRLLLLNSVFCPFPVSELKGTVIYSTKLFIIFPSTPPPLGSTLNPLPTCPPSMGPTSGTSAAKAQPGHQALSSSSSAFRTQDSERSSKEELNQASLRLSARPDDSLRYAAVPCPFYLPELGPLLTKPSDIHDSFDPIMSHIKSYRSGSRPVYDPLKRFLEEAPREQPWWTLVHFAKDTERDGPGK